LLGIPYSFSPGEDAGETDLTVTRLIQEWLDRRQDRVIAARSTLSIGLDAWDATIHDSGPDGEFVAWLGQFQWAQRFGAQDYQLVFKTNLQLADQPLLSMEKCALGGMDSVRGYAENTLVRDRCFMSSLELRVPVYQLPLAGLSHEPGDGQVQLAAFLDYGQAHNRGGFDLAPNVIASAGLGLRWEPGAKVRAQLYWGYPFQAVATDDSGGLGSRVHFSIQAAY
jgi:hemolysin activation/secretion protein